MKRRDLEKRLNELGFTLYRNGGNHDIFVNQSGATIPVPRHREIKETTAKLILKTAKRA